MDELKLRLEYLEHVTQGTDDEESLMNQVGAIGSTLDTMLGVRQNEVKRMANEFNKQGIVPNEADGVRNTPAQPGADARAAPSSDESEEMKRMMVASRFDDLSKLATELEAQLPLEMAEMKPPPNPQALIEKASELGREFDELTVRSAELTKRLMEQLAKDNEALAATNS